MNNTRVAVMGLGTMGSGMAHNLLLKGFPVTVFNRNPEKARPLVQKGAEVAGSPKEAAASAEVIISMVADDRASRAVWLGDAGALAGVAAGTVCIECSTLTVSWVRELAAAVNAKECEFLDAPVTGSKMQAAGGELNFIVGGATTTLAKVQPVLAAMSKSVNSVGPVGSGALIKLINNFLCGVQVATLAEALTMIERGGLDQAKALEIIANGAPGSPLVKVVSQRMTENDYAPNFRLDLMAKDLSYAIEEGEKLSVDLVTATAALRSFKQAIEHGDGDKDMAALFETVKANHS